MKADFTYQVTCFCTQHQLWHKCEGAAHVAYALYTVQLFVQCRLADACMDLQQHKRAPSMSVAKKNKMIKFSDNK
jgi:hypothetical protein